MSYAGLMHLSIVYVLWGSTFLAIRVAVREGSGFPPFTMAASRVLLAGVILLFIVAVRRKQLQPRWVDMPVLVGSGLLLWTGGNGLVTFSEQRTDSGLAALVIASVPIWVAVFESLLDRRPPSGLLVVSLATALLGVALLTAPSFVSGVPADRLSILILLGGALSWSFGTVWLKRKPPELGMQANSAYQNLFGGLGFYVLVLLTQEPIADPQPEAWWAWAYLIGFGSIIGYTSYIQSLRLLPTSVATTNAFVNPVIAVVLGAIVLGEEVTATVLLGAALVLAGVAGVFRDRMKTPEQVLAAADGE